MSHEEYPEEDPLALTQNLATDVEDWPQGYEMRADGLYFLQEPAVFLCQHFVVLGQTNDGCGGAQGVAIAFADASQRNHIVVVPRADLAGGAQQILRDLLSHGFCIGLDPGSWRLLQQFFLILCPRHRCQVVTQTGWIGANFVLPHKVFGPDSEHLFPAVSTERSASITRGTLGQWKQEVSALCTGNDRLVFLVSLGFAAPLLPLIDLDAAHFHLVDTRKSNVATALLCAASVASPAPSGRFFQTEPAAFEEVGPAYRHQMLVLRDFTNLLPRQLNSLVSALARGRTSSGGRSVEPGPWEGLILSAGESGLQTHRFSAPGSMPTIDLPAQDADGASMFSNWHGDSQEDAFEQRLRHGGQRAYGSALCAFLEALCQQRLPEIGDTYAQHEREFFQRMLPAAGFDSLRCIAQIFSLVGFAGEWASRYGVTGWAQGEALRASARLFDEWRVQLGHYDSHETQQVLEQVRTFLETQAHRFQPADGQAGAKNSRAATNLAGYVLRQRGREHHFVKASVFSQQVLRGLDRDMAIEILMEAGILLVDPQTQKPFMSKRLPTARGYTQRVYHLVDALNEKPRTIDGSTSNSTRFFRD